MERGMLSRSPRDERDALETDLALRGAVRGDAAALRGTDREHDFPPIVIVEIADSKDVDIRAVGLRALGRSLPPGDALAAGCRSGRRSFEAGRRRARVEQGVQGK